MVRGNHWTLSLIAQNDFIVENTFVIENAPTFHVQLLYDPSADPLTVRFPQPGVAAVVDLPRKCWEHTCPVVPRGTVSPLRRLCTAGLSAICLYHSAFSVGPFLSLDGSNVQPLQTDHGPVFCLMSPSLWSVTAGFTDEISANRRPNWPSLLLLDRWVFELAATP